MITAVDSSVQKNVIKTKNKVMYSVIMISTVLENNVDHL